MTPPQLTDYVDAVQDPRTAFLDPDLGNGQVETDPRGWPRSYSGGFAIVFRVSTADGATWAVRCFHRRIDDLADRYRAIAEAIRATRSPYFVDVAFRDQGIRVNGTVWPIITMRWVDGQLLSRVLEQRPKAETIGALRRAFETMVLSLQRAGIAHGDLMPDNILVTPSQSLVLIDYDDMYVPAMAGRFEQRGLGNRNFQHPQRARAKFDGRLDDFSAMVIWSGLLVLEQHPEWWERFGSEEKALLFKGADFERPDASPIFSELQRDPELAWVADQLAAVATADVELVPSFASFIEGKLPRLSARRPSQAAPAIGERPVGPPPLLDLRRDDPTSLVGTLVRVVGEVTDTHRGTTRFGTPYLFVNLGSSGRRKIQLVFWADALRLMDDATLARLMRRGRLVRASGLVTTYQGRPQIEIDGPAQLTFLRAEQARQLLGSRWTDAPPPWPRLQEPRVGDRVFHDKFGFGLIKSVYADAVLVGFGDADHEISYEQYFLGLVDRMVHRPDGTSPSGSPVSQRATSRSDRPATAARPGPARSRTGEPAGNNARPKAAPGHGMLLSSSEADRLEALFGGVRAGRTPNPSSATATPRPSPKVRPSTRPSAATQSSSTVSPASTPPRPAAAAPAVHRARRSRRFVLGVVGPVVAAASLVAASSLGVLEAADPLPLGLAMAGLLAIAAIVVRSMR